MAPPNRSGVSVYSVNSGSPAATGSPGPRWIRMPAPNCTCPPGRRAARAEPPHRQSHRHRVDVAHRATTRCGDGLGMRTDRQRLRTGRRPARPPGRGSGPWRCRRPACRPGRPRRPPPHPASRRPAPASAPPRRRGRRPPAPPVTRRPRPRCRRRVPAAPSMSVSSARVATPCAVPSSTIVRASSRASASVLRKAPRPTLVSSTRASAPSASFLLITELAISGSDSVVAVTSRSA